MIRAFLVFIGFALFIMSCSDDDNNPPDQNTSSMSYKLDGKEIKATGIYAYGFLFSDGEIGVYAASNDPASKELCYIIIPAGTPTGEHLIKDVVKGYYNSKDDESYYSAFSDGGQLILEHKDDVSAKGTFYFKAGDGNTPGKTVNITEGKFNVLIR